MTSLDAQIGQPQVLAGLGARFDHVAHAVPSIRAALPLYRDLLGGRPYAGGINPWGGHLGLLLMYPGEKKLELLEPVRPDSPAVSRFLAEHPRGGLHHITFRVPDLAAAVDVLSGSGYKPFGTRLEDPAWRETYLHPRETGGVLIQLVEAAENVPGPLDVPVDELLARAEALRLASHAHHAPSNGA
ncbi:VOC family protein [Frankia sp. CNm7]|uniref:VOC family protein n=1 Tax=Frankia nepalensis TaxID=1836974 RepID=A0A937RJ49_9ACTN|nr:VOC family protein [Frankia nepalensis]MBL7498702.1 VOC family protein [Frankia nepalensis]MBL7512924.1 VOC family protein [Frankia nepalensis]MBL7521658.1 VOC family protein [Frankia nepalensis]MBL7633213.1 VOC family protein [Frankia nepalensis]